MGRTCGTLVCILKASSGDLRGRRKEQVLLACRHQTWKRREHEFPRCDFPCLSSKRRCVCRVSSDPVGVGYCLYWYPLIIPGWFASGSPGSEEEKSCACAVAKFAFLSWMVQLERTVPFSNAIVTETWMCFVCCIFFRSLSRLLSLSVFQEEEQDLCSVSSRRTPAPTDFILIAEFTGLILNPYRSKREIRLISVW